ncbi:hypothetical protein [Cohnella zeiphila]|uniref:hypothetical protein n=1 Tax=Cohnella zeiphila TaxID=2761120 RepID=UPI00192D6282|nr:hypothetical protein [Cohnella zeiphila]
MPEKITVIYLQSRVTSSPNMVSNPPDEALVSWFREGVAFVQSYSGVVVLMASAHADPNSALKQACGFNAELRYKSILNSR